MKTLGAVVLLASTLIGCGDNITPEPRIVGTLWNDANSDRVRDPSETPLRALTVFLDLNANGTLDEGETTARTDGDGHYELVVPEAGVYTVRQVLPFGFRSGLAAAKPDLTEIIGGSDSFAGQYGFMVAVGDKFDGQVFQFCGGVLITDRHVVTAAHCSAGAQPTKVGVVAGTLDPFAKDGVVLDVANITIHPDYDGEPEHGHDIALWTLTSPVPLAAKGLTTVEMASAATDPVTRPGAVSTTLGWGVSDRDSALLQQVHLPLVSAAECAAVYPESTGFDTQICAGAPEGGIDSCQGDSGGPLLVRDAARGVWVHAGITSYGDGCALADTPGVYSRVSALSGWVVAQALEPGAAVQVSVVEGVGTADFPTRATTRPQVGDIDPRWQITGMSLPEAVPENTPLDITWRIFGDADAKSGFTCTFDVDGAGSQPAADVACGPGITTFPLAGLATGIFPAELTVTRLDVTLARRVNVFAGTPVKVDTAGALTAQDGLDPDYPDPFRVDYFDVTGLSGTKTFAVELASNQINGFLTLYDLDLRDFVVGGGILAFGDDLDNGHQRLVVTPEAGVHYVIGVSTFSPNDVGNYQISIINDGTLTAH